MILAVLVVVGLLVPLVVLSVLYGTHTCASSLKTLPDDLLPPATPSLPPPLRPIRSIVRIIEHRAAQGQPDHSVRMAAAAVLITSPIQFMQMPTHRSPLDLIDHIYYINLDSREDRRLLLLADLERMGFDMARVERMPGVVDKFGPLGCSKAHRNALRACKEAGYRNCLILEDDFMFKCTPSLLYQYLYRLWTLQVEYDVIMWAANVERYHPTHIDFLARIDEALTTSGYLVHQKAVDALLSNVEEGIALLEDSDSMKHELAIDVYWKPLQGKMQWFMLHPLIGHQRPLQFSDIEQRIISHYPDQNELALMKDQVPFDFLIVQQNGSTLRSLTGCPSYYWQIDPLLDGEGFVWDEDQRIIRTDDTPLALINALRMYTSCNTRAMAVKGVIFQECSKHGELVANVVSLWEEYADTAFWTAPGYGIYVRRDCLDIAMMNGKAALGSVSVPEFLTETLRKDGIILVSDKNRLAA